MTMPVWRVTQFPGVDGIGGLYSDGRWHTKGVHIVYASEHPALAVLEAMAHLSLELDGVPTTLKLCRLELEDGLAIHQPSLPAGWQANEAMSRKVGNAWLTDASTPLMRVPSAILPHSYNMIVNPAHPDVVGRISQASIEPIWIDPRFIRP
jgi:RES domain-containing protein